MRIRIEQMRLDNLEDIYDFEVENKVYFETILPPRSEGYFNLETFKILMNEILEEQLNGECYLCLVFDIAGKMVGRVNLSSIRDEKVRKAEIGYRISEKEQGKGYATESVRIMFEEGIGKFGLELIEAGTSTMNVGSQRVLIKNGFVLVGEEEKVMKVNGEWVDGLLFEKYCDKN